MVQWWRAVASLTCSTLLLSCIVAASVIAEEHFLDYSEDKYKVVFISGNLTAAITHDYPRVVLEHSTDPFSPTFEVGFPRIYLFNDSNADGEFTMSEVKYVSYLDEDHVTWTATPVEFRNDTVAGEYASFRMSATLNLYRGLDNETVSFSAWANITFWFRISERNITLSNSLGSYVVKGKTDLILNYTLDIARRMDTTGMAIEQLLQGGGSATMFILKQKGSHADVVDRMVASRFNERVYGPNFTNDFLATSLAEQNISFAKEDGTVMAHYRWDSIPVMERGGTESAVQANCSYYTTGTGMVLHSAYFSSNLTGSLNQEASVGIDESGFTVRITDWIRRNVVSISLFVGSIVALVAVAAVLVRRRKSSMAKTIEKPQDDKSKSDEV